MNPARCHTISAGEPFLETLARRVLERHGGDAASLPCVLVLLPNRRACRGLREAFLQVSGGRPLLLPRIQPIGELEEDPLSWAAAGPELPPPLPPLRRLLLLAAMVGRAENVSPPQAVELAGSLGNFLDEVARHDLDPGNLEKLAPESLAGHWQHTRDFLMLLARRWPDILKEEGALDAAVHRRRLLLSVAKAWRNQPPDHPVIAAGSTGSQPATAALLAAVVRLPQGEVILPGLDRDMPGDEWDVLTETHPQFGLKQLLEHMGCKREEVQIIPESSGELPRMAALRAVFQPAEATKGWLHSMAPLAKGLRGVRLVAADTPLDEARMIAVALREAVETPGRTAALVTPDRALARMVAAQTRRFGIEIDDSAGRPLMDTPPGCLLRLAAEATASRAAPAELLAMLRHPLAGAGMNTAACRLFSRRLEIKLLRGIRPAPGIKALADATHSEPGIFTPLAEMEKRMRPFSALLARPEAAFSELLAAHIAFAEWVASTDAEIGADRLWAGQAGEQLAAFLAGLAEQAGLIGAIDPAGYPAMLEALLQGEKWRPRFGLHPRLHILSPIEARLQRFDLVILAGLNEGAWPALPAADPWMSRPMRREFGLPAAEESIGQSAHDVMMLCAAPDVLLTRSRKAEGSPAVPSRWLVRLETLVKGRDPALWQSLSAQDHFERGLAALDAPLDLPPLSAPAPRPPFAARPRRLSATAIDTWLRDPYMIYARYVLRLKPLDSLDQDPDAADFGNAVHAALERFAHQYPDALPDAPYEKLLECGRAAFAGLIDRPAVACLWWPRFEATARWLMDMEHERRRGARVLGEVNGEWGIEVDGRPFLLTVRIDRLELHDDGRAVIADYKTGSVPSKTDVSDGRANQLPLGALVATHGTLTPPVDLSGVSKVAFEYWKLAGVAERCEVHEVEADTGQALARLRDLVRRFDDAAEPYLVQGNPEFNDYAQLERRQEWEG